MQLWKIGADGDAKPVPVRITKKGVACHQRLVVVRLSRDTYMTMTPDEALRAAEYLTDTAHKLYDRDLGIEALRQQEKTTWRTKKNRNQSGGG